VLPWVNRLIPIPFLPVRLQNIGCFFEWAFPHFVAVKSVGFQFNHQSDCTSGASLSKAGMSLGIRRVCLSDRTFVRLFCPIAKIFRKGNILKHSTIVLASIPALFLATTAGAATLTTQKFLVTDYYDNSLSANDHDPRDGKCDVVNAIWEEVNCEEEFNLSLPDVEFKETHDLESIGIRVDLIYGYRSVGGGFDDDLLADHYGYEFFDDLRIDASYHNSTKVNFFLTSALGGMFGYEKYHDISFRCQSDNSDPIGLGDGECRNYKEVQGGAQADLGVVSGASLDVLMSQDPVLKYQRLSRTLITDQDDDDLGTQDSFKSIFSLGLTYTYVDKPVVTPPDVPAPSVVPLPAGLPLLAAGLMTLGILKRRQTGSRTNRS
jgi:hypothetical protein